MMLNPLNRWMESISNYALQWTLRKVLQPVVDRMSSVVLQTAGLVIHGASSPLAKAGSAFYYFANGVLGKVAANTDMAALVGTVTNGKFNVYCFFIDSGGNLTSAMGTEGADRAHILFPQFPVEKACIGFVLINPTGTGNFVGGTTALDDGTVVPNAEYVNLTEGCDPWVLVGPGALQS